MPTAPDSSPGPSGSPASSGSSTDTAPAITTIDGLGRAAAAHRALGQLLFETLGGWATADDAHTSPGVRPFYAAWAQHHAWHAELWAARHPSTPLADLDGATSTARTRLTAVADTLGALGTDAERLAFLAGQVLHQLANVLAEHRSRIDERLEAPTARVLDLVLTDVHRDLESARRLVNDQDVTVPEIDIAAVLG